MYTIGVIATTLFVVLCIEFGQGLECYQHDFCMGNTCSNLSQTITTCAKNESRCWKLTIPLSLGTKRGCGDNKCLIQVNAGSINTANVCCEEDLCNSSIQVQTTILAIVFMSLIAFVYRLYFE